jgi:exopolysaccharide production protein ExoQ
MIAGPRGRPGPAVSARRRLSNAGGRLFPSILLTIQAMELICPQGFDYSQSLTASMPTEGDSLDRFVWMFLVLGALYLLIKNKQTTVTLLKRFNPFILVFLGLAALSVIWSIEPGVTIRRVYRFATVLMVCMAFMVQGWDRERYQKFARLGLTFILIASFIFVLAAPQYAVHTQPAPELKGAWRGITEGKNILGPLAADAIIFWLHAWLAKESKPLTAAGGMLLGMFILYKTRSDSSMFATAFGIPFMLLLLRQGGGMKRYMPYIVGLFASAIGVYALAVLNILPGSATILSPITLITGKTLTFSNRTAIWAVLEAHIRLHPLLGTGFGAYWYDSPESPSQDMIRLIFFYPTEGHNGYLDVINDTGYVGFMVLICYFVSYLRQSLYLLRRDKYQAALYLTLIFRGFIGDLSESHWFFVLNIGFLLMTFATAAVSRSYMQARAEESAARGVRAQPRAGPRRPGFAR